MYMIDLYNPSEKSIYFQYLDSNNLYRWTMVKIYQHMDLNGRMQRTLLLKKQVNLSKKTRGDIF